MARSPAVKMASRLELVPVADLIPYSRNARTHSTEQIDKIASSIIEFGFTAPVLIDGEKGVMAGHGRLLAAVRIGLKKVPVIRLDHLSEDQKRAYIIADNRIALDAGWDDAILAGELAALSEADFDLALTGFNEEEISALLDAEMEGEGGNTEDDAAPSAPERPTSIPGDLWILGSHRLLCGDATVLEHLKRLMGKDRANCLWTDPPYNVEYVGKTPDALTIQNDAQTAGNFCRFLQGAFSAAIQVMRDGAPAYIAHAHSEGIAFHQAFETAGFHFAGCLIWRKNTLVLGHADYHYRHEPILYGWKPGTAHAWYGGRDKTTIVELEDSLWQQTGENEWQIAIGEQVLIVRGENLTVQAGAGTVFFEEKPTRSAEHPTMKPVALIERMLTNSTKRGEIVLDCFGGSGSTLIAAHKLMRRARLVELDPRFVDVAVERWQEFTGKEATLESTGETFKTMTNKRIEGDEDE